MKLFYLLVVMCTTIALNAATLRVLNVMSEPILVRYQVPGEMVQSVYLTERQFADIPNVENIMLLTIEGNGIIADSLADVRQKIGRAPAQDLQFEILDVPALSAATADSARRFEFDFEQLQNARIRGAIKKDFSVWYDTFPELTAAIAANNIKAWQIFGAPDDYEFYRDIEPKYTVLRAKWMRSTNTGTIQERAHAHDMVDLLEAAYGCLFSCEQFKSILNEKVYSLPEFAQRYGSSVSAAVLSGQ